MEDVKLSVRALAAMMKVSIEELANLCDISPGHLKSVSSGRAEMTAKDLARLSKVTGVPTDNILID